MKTITLPSGIQAEIREMSTGDWLAIQKEPDLVDVERSMRVVAASLYINGVKVTWEELLALPFSDTQLALKETNNLVLGLIGQDDEGNV